MGSVRETTSASNEPICKEKKDEFLIAQIDQWLPMIALIAISFSRLDFLSIMSFNSFNGNDTVHWQFRIYPK
jgi:hypothetical protein